MWLQTRTTTVVTVTIEMTRLINPLCDFYHIVALDLYIGYSRT